MTTRTGFDGQAWARAIEALFLSPLMLPTLALGLALLMLFNLAGTGLSFWTLVAGHVAITAPYVFRTTAASLVQMDPALLESARSLGAGDMVLRQQLTLQVFHPLALALLAEYERYSLEQGSQRKTATWAEWLGEGSVISQPVRDSSPRI